MFVCLPYVIDKTSLHRLASPEMDRRDIFVAKFAYVSRNYGNLYMTPDRVCSVPTSSRYHYKTLYQFYVLYMINKQTETRLWKCSKKIVVLAAAIAISLVALRFSFHNNKKKTEIKSIHNIARFENKSILIWKVTYLPSMSRVCGKRDHVYWRTYCLFCFASLWTPK